MAENSGKPNLEIMLAPNKYYQAKGDPPFIWANVHADAARREQCLCMNCERKNEMPMYSSCPTAHEIYEISKKSNMAMTITRCGATDADGKLLYKPLEKKPN